LTAGQVATEYAVLRQRQGAVKKMDQNERDRVDKLTAVVHYLETVVSDIKDTTPWKHAKIVALCSEPQKGDVRFARDKQIDAYVPKPILKDTLVDVIATALGDARPDGPIATRHLAQELSCKGMRILLAEDNPVNVKLMKILLTNLECTFDIVSDGQAACDALKRNRYDLVLMDVQMPVLNGLDATKIIREEMNIQVPIIALTAAALQEEKKKCYRSGMDDILLKPIKIEELKEKLRTWGKFKGWAIESRTSASGRSHV
jgi:two-component system sensor histidine kinase/response regulator